jgi:membrane protein DedA with SNARE-associated domain
VQHLISQYGYLAVFVLMLAESACVPIPSEAIMMFAGALAAGAVPGAHPALAGVVAAGVFGNVAGSYLSWAVGRYAGQAAIRRWGRRVGIREHEIDKAMAWFDRHGPVAVLVGRVIPVIRTFISLPAGFADMPAGTFGLYTTLGAIPWTAALGIAGYAVGANWEHVANDFHGPTYVIAAVLVAGLAVWLVRRRRRGNAGAAGNAVPANGQTVSAERGAYPDRPGYQGDRPGYPADRPGYPAGGPAYPAERPGYPAGGPAYPAERPGYPVGRPAYPDDGQTVTVARRASGDGAWGPPAAEPWHQDTHLTVR